MSAPSGTLGDMGLRMIGLAFGWVFLLVGLASVLLYLSPTLQLAHRYTAMAASFIPYGTIAWLGALVLFLFAGQGWTRLISLVAVAGLALQVFWASGYLPIKTASDKDAGTTLLTFNSRCDSTWKEDVGQTLLHWQPDIAVIQGAESGQSEHLEELGIGNVYPYEVFFPMESLPSCGTRIYSKTPLADVSAGALGEPVVLVQISGVETALMPVDTVGPQKGMRAWNAELEAIGIAAAGLDVPVVLAGDFNAVAEHAPMRSLKRTAQVTDAARYHGWLRTWRANRRPGPLIQIDHVLISDDFRATSAETIQVGTSAHRAILVNLVAE